MSHPEATEEQQRNIEHNRIHGVLCACNRAMIPYRCSENLDLRAYEWNATDKRFMGHGYDDCDHGYPSDDDGQREGKVDLHERAPMTATPGLASMIYLRLSESKDVNATLDELHAEGIDIEAYRTKHGPNGTHPLCDLWSIAQTTARPILTLETGSAYCDTEFVADWWEDGTTLVSYDEHTDRDGNAMADVATAIALFRHTTDAEAYAALLRGDLTEAVRLSTLARVK